VMVKAHNNNASRGVIVAKLVHFITENCW
jgi:hypothetical protein